MNGTRRSHTVAIDLMPPKITSAVSAATRYKPCRGAGLPERAWILEEDPPFKIEAGDPYYLVLAKKRIVGVYNRKYYEFEGGEQ